MATTTPTFSHLSRASAAGLALLAVEIRAARKERRMTEAELAERAGCSRDTVRAIEAGKPTVAIGHVLEVAAILGLDLFGGTEATEARLGEVRSRLRLLPERVRKPTARFDDDF